MPSDSTWSGRFITVWRRGLAGTWHVAAHVQNGLLPAQNPDLSGVVMQTVGAERPNDAFASADIAFARMAADSRAPTAFAHFVAPTGITFAGTGELNIGPEMTRSRMSQSPAAKASWRWRPVVSLSAKSQDLGATIGEAEITPVGSTQANHSKYLTVWLRQPDGTLKFVVDGGSSRPRRPQ